MEDLRKLDALYEPVSTFDKWLGCFVDLSRWDRYTAKLKELENQSPELLGRSRDIVKRATAIDTGAIEGLYEVDRDFTITVAMHAAGWKAKLHEKTEATRDLIDSQLRGYDYLLDLVTESVPLTETLVRKLHQELCASQKTCRVLTDSGWRDQRFPLGEYKHYPNHVTTNGVRVYVPVDEASAEMHRLCDELRSKRFLAAHPILQAAYAHHSLMWIHPFAGGNGRVARALASFYTYRAALIPLMVLMDRRKEYLTCLHVANNGPHQPFVDFVFERAIDAVELVGDSFAEALAPEVGELLNDLMGLYLTDRRHGGHTPERVNEAGLRLLTALHHEVDRLVNEYKKGPQFSVRASAGSMPYEPGESNMRSTSPGETNIVRMNYQFSEPAKAELELVFALELPIDCDGNDATAIRCRQTGDVFEVRIADLLPTLSESTQFRIQMFAKQVFGKALKELIVLAKSNLANGGHVQHRRSPP